MGRGKGEVRCGWGKVWWPVEDVVWGSASFGDKEKDEQKIGKVRV